MIRQAQPFHPTPTSTHRVVELTHSQHALRAVDFLFQRPSLATTHFVEASGIPKPTAKRILILLREAGVLVALREGKGRRAGIYAFRELLNIAEGRTVF
ncbi:MAG: hypothetical protein AB1634_14060 [Thermodesulfobacteriota bacterium]